MTDILNNAYRPTKWEDVLGQGAIVKSIRKVLKNKLSRAFLLTGPSGTGKTTIARIAAAECGCEKQNIIEIAAAIYTGVDAMRQVVIDSSYGGFGATENKAIIVDECFVRGTLIDTPNGPAPIETLRTGDKIIGALGIDTIKRTMRKHVSLTRIVQLRLENGCDIWCSKEHPFLTDNGWCNAENLYAKRISTIQNPISPQMLQMWDSIYKRGQRISLLQKMQKIIRKALSTKMHILRKKLSYKFFRFTNSNLFQNLWQQSRGEQTAWPTPRLLEERNQRRPNEKQTRETGALEKVSTTVFDTNVLTQSNADENCDRKDDCYQGKQWNLAQMAWDQRRERNWADKSASFTSLIGWWSIGMADLYWQTTKARMANLLQSRYWISRTQIGDRNRWKGAQSKGKKNKGQTERGSFEKVRVENSPFLERTDNGQAEYNSELCEITVECYDLEIENHPSYSVEGLIVHNCHRLSKNAWDGILKAVEEPPPHVYWFFCTTEIDKVPKTIRTRCASFTLKPVPDDDIREILCDVADKEDFPVSDSVIDMIVRESHGSPRQALVYLAVCSDVKDRSEAAKLMQSAIDSEPVIELCRFLAKPGSWLKAMKIVERLEDENPESVRIVVCNYMTKVAMNAKSNDAACTTLNILDAFSIPFNQSDGMAPLLTALGKVMFTQQ